MGVVECRGKGGHSACGWICVTHIEKAVMVHCQVPLDGATTGVHRGRVQQLGREPAVGLGQRVREGVRVEAGLTQLHHPRPHPDERFLGPCARKVTCRAAAVVTGKLTACSIDS